VRPQDRLLCFLFSCRRRHTRSKRDWSPDVCSSDLPVTAPTPVWDVINGFGAYWALNSALDLGLFDALAKGPSSLDRLHGDVGLEIGRASCREREESVDVNGSVEEATTQTQSCARLY